jgi:hypothetical protein
MKISPVKSSNITGLGYDRATGEMHVRFAVGGTYVHKGVTIAQYADFSNAKSLERN